VGSRNIEGRKERGGQQSKEMRQNGIHISEKGKKKREKKKRKKLAERNR
jgi:hypothetical protein